MKFKTVCQIAFVLTLLLSIRSLAVYAKDNILDVQNVSTISELPKLNIEKLSKIEAGQKYSELDKLKAQRQKNIDFLKAIATTTNEKK